MKKIWAFVIFISVSVFLFSCTKNNEVIPPQTNVQVSNLCADAPPLDIYLNNNSFVSGLYYFNYQPYSQVYPGTNNFIATVSNTTTPILNVNANFLAGENYSFFIIDSLNAITAAYTQDDLTVPVGDSAKIRILDFAPNAGNVDVANTSGGSVIYAGRYFNDQTNVPQYAQFVSVPAGNYSFDIRKAGTSTVLLSGVNYAPLPVSAGGIYTIVLSGIIGASGTQAFSVSAINNN